MSERTYTSYPSLYNVGHKAVQNIFLDPVTVEEKVDGSQFSFGVTGGVLQCRSKRCVLDGSIPDIFSGAVATATRLFEEGRLSEGMKNYARFGADKKPLFAKYVSEAFREIHSGDWKERHPGNGDIIQKLIDKYRTPARWEKACQHLRDDGSLTDSLKDIGPIISECQADILKECGEEIREALMQWAWRQVACKVVGGLPQWYKDKLLDSQPFHEVS